MNAEAEKLMQAGEQAEAEDVWDILAQEEAFDSSDDEKDAINHVVYLTEVLGVPNAALMDDIDAMTNHGMSTAEITDELEHLAEDKAGENQKR